jgi:hypothetical protein
LVLKTDGVSKDEMKRRIKGAMLTHRPLHGSYTVNTKKRMLIK